MTTPPTFAGMERVRACDWKRFTRTLPEEARRPAPYVGKDGSASRKPLDFCLPADYADYSLLPEVRELALTLAELSIPWHAGVGGGPSNHLLSSQVQCVNALGQMVTDADRLKCAFGGILDTAEIVPIEPGRFLTFEYIGPTDYFREAVGGRRVRGARCTSVDAAFVQRCNNGIVELVLIEWKFTESYRRRTADPERDALRWTRYGAALTAVDGPVRGDVLGFGDLLQEPFYQLMRQQLLAYALEADHAHGADLVRVVHVLPAGNAAYRLSLHGPAPEAIGSSVGEVWQKLLRYPDRFVAVDSALFLDPAVTSAEYVSRYGGGLEMAGCSHLDERDPKTQCSLPGPEMGGFGGPTVAAVVDRDRPREDRAGSAPDETTLSPRAGS